MSDKEPREHLRYGDILAEERERLGYTQAEFAPLIGVKIQRMRALESSSGRLPSFALLTAMAVRGVDVNYLLRGRRAVAQDEVAISRPDEVR